MAALSVLDLSPIPEGASAAEAFRNTVGLARHAERLGFRRYWLAEHHNMAGIGSAATAVLIGHVAGATESIRVGAGGIMLPNHAPLVIAEQFGTLESLYPGRIDLGIGRAPGTDRLTSHALRRTLSGDVNDFPRDVVELQSYFQPVRAGQRVRAVPGAGLGVPIWILGSSLFGAQLAAALGLPYAFASHFAPAALMQAIAIYREQFRPSEQCAAPYVMAGFNVFAADSADDAAYVWSSAQQSVLNLHRGVPGPLPRPVRGFEATLDAEQRAILARWFTCAASGTAETVAGRLAAFAAETGVDEIMVTSNIHDHAARLRSYEITAEAGAALARKEAAAT